MERSIGKKGCGCASAVVAAPCSGCSEVYAEEPQAIATKFFDRAPFVLPASLQPPPLEREEVLSHPIGDFGLPRQIGPRWEESRQGLEELEARLRSELTHRLQMYGSSVGLQGPPGLSAVVQKVEAEGVTVDATPLVVASQALPTASKSSFRALVLGTGSDNVNHRWWDIEATFRRDLSGVAIQSGSIGLQGGFEGGSAANWQAQLVANGSGGVDLEVVGGPATEIRWDVVLMTQVAEPDVCAYRRLTQGGGALSSSLIAGQICVSVSRGSTYLAKYFRLSVPVGTTLTIDMTGGGFDTYMYLLAGTDKNGVLLAQDDDSGPGTDSQIIYTTQVQDGADFVVECTSFGAGATGGFAIAVA